MLGQLAHVKYLTSLENFYIVFLCVHAFPLTYPMAYTWRSEDSLWELVLSPVVPREVFRLDSRHFLLDGPLSAQSLLTTS